MRILIIAYQFAYMRSPRALRWYYLTRELACLGHEVHVLTPGRHRNDRVENGVYIHETFPGPVAWALRFRARGASGTDDTTHSVSVPATRLNWKGRLAQVLKRWLAKALFPGEDAEWLPWANKRMLSLLHSWVPDVVISSHEPASSLLLGLKAKQQGVAWVADLGDPVCAPYTVRRWHKKALRLEARCMREADCVIVPNECARSFYVARHGGGAERFFVLPQGYDDREPSTIRRRTSRRAGMLELVFAGRVYPFRDPRPLLQAVAGVSGVRLTMILADPPDEDVSMEFRKESRIRFVSAMSHQSIHAVHEAADVLVSIGNAGMPGQVPGKIFEYMGVARPVLHLYAATDEQDCPAELVRRHRRGWCCPNDHDAIHNMLVKLLSLCDNGKLAAGLSLAPVREFAFSEQGKQLALRLIQVTHCPHGRRTTCAMDASCGGHHGLNNQR